MTTIFQLFWVGFNFVLLLAIPIALYFIIKLAVRNGINESKLVKQQDKERNQQE